MASMNISVPDPMREWVQRRIESGEYASVSDYVRDLIRRDQNAQTRRLSVEDIHRTIEEGRAAAGGTSPAEDVFARIEDKLRRLAG
jgi:antitoxin ParD1/3/4